METRNTLRLGVGSPAGPQSAVWRIWVDPKGDIYVASRSIAHRFKASLHASGNWRIGYSESHASEIRLPPEQDRAVMKWSSPPEIAPSVQKAFAIIIPASEVVSPARPGSSDPAIHWEPAPPDGMATAFALWRIRRSVSFTKVRVIAQIPLPGGGALGCTVEVADEGPAEHAKRAEDRKMLLADLGDAYPEAKPNEVRGVVAGYLPDSTRCFTDLVLR